MKPKTAPARHMSLPDAFALAQQLHRDGAWQGAEALYQRILKIMPNHVDTLHFLGVVSHQLGKEARAVEMIRRALTLQPEYVDAYNNLGNVLKEQGRMEEAKAMYREVIARRPQAADAYNNLGVTHKEQGEYQEAIEAYRKALEINSDYADAWHNLGNALKKTGQLDEALDAYRRAIALRPYHTESYKNMGAALYVAGRIKEAVEVYQQWIERDPNNAVARHMLAACSGEAVPERASDDYVRTTFDGFASNFDVVLERLEYRAPTLVAMAVEQQLGAPTGSLSILDAGCGTGLCGPSLRPYAQSLIGVDLSAGMLAKASGREVYDELIAAELTAYMAGLHDHYDLIVSADTLCYFGALEAVLKAACQALRLRGILTFTVEHASDQEAPSGSLIQPHGRYAHSETYVNNCLTRAGLDVIEIQHVVLRMEAGKPVNGLLVIARKP